MLDKIAGGLVADHLTFGFVVTCAGLFAIGAVAQLLTRGAAPLARVTPSALVSLGVLGTFAGIFLGLVDFDVTNIDQSVTKLLEGMKFAFITSIVGMTLGIVFKLLQAATPAASDAQAEDVTGGDLLRALHEVRDVVRAGNESSTAAIDRLRAGIVGDGETSLTTQMQKLRTSLTDKLDDLRKDTSVGFERMQLEFQKFAAQVVT
jgi:hypothetical protein